MISAFGHGPRDGSGRGDGEAKFGLHALGEALGATGRTSPNGDRLKRAYLADGAGVGGGLFAVAEKGHAARIFACKCVGGNRAGGRGADGRDFAGIDYANGCAGFGVEDESRDPDAIEFRERSCREIR